MIAHKDEKTAMVVDSNKKDREWLQGENEKFKKRKPRGQEDLEMQFERERDYLDQKTIAFRENVLRQHYDVEWWKTTTTDECGVDVGYRVSDRLTSILRPRAIAMFIILLHIFENS